MSAAGQDGGWTPARSVAGSRNPWSIVAVISIATFMVVLDTSIANVALDHIAGGLSASYDEATWVVTSYLVANAVIIPASGWIADVVGRKRYYMISVAVFTGASLLCGLSQSLSFLVVARIGECAARVAEQLVFEQVVGNGAAVHGNERAALAFAQQMRHAGAQFLAGPGFASEENGRVIRTEERDPFDDAEKSGIAADKLFEPDLGGQRSLDFGDIPRPRPQEPADAALQLVRPNRRQEKVVNSLKRGVEQPAIVGRQDGEDGYGQRVIAEPMKEGRGPRFAGDRLGDDQMLFGAAHFGRGERIPCGAARKPPLRK